MMDNTINTWAQGYFVDQPQYRGWSPDQKNDANRCEALLVRPGATANAICQAVGPSEAQWIASRLNLATEVESLRTKLETYERAMLKVRKVLCGDINNQDDIVEMAKSLRKDAERYRWLRDMDHWPACFDSHHAPEPVCGPELDAAIDAVMKESEKC